MHFMPERPFFSWHDFCSIYKQHNKKPDKAPGLSMKRRISWKTQL